VDAAMFVDIDDDVAHLQEHQMYETENARNTEQGLNQSGEDDQTMDFVGDKSGDMGSVGAVRTIQVDGMAFFLYCWIFFRFYSLFVLFYFHGCHRRSHSECRGRHRRCLRPTYAKLARWYVVCVISEFAQVELIVVCLLFNSVQTCSFWSSFPRKCSQGKFCGCEGKHFHYHQNHIVIIFGAAATCNQWQGAWKICGCRAEIALV